MQSLVARSSFAKVCGVLAPAACFAQNAWCCLQRCQIHPETLPSIHNRRRPGPVPAASAAAFCRLLQRHGPEIMHQATEPIDPKLDFGAIGSDINALQRQPHDNGSTAWLRAQHCEVLGVICAPSSEANAGRQSG